MKPYKSNIEEETIDNKNYRKVLHTGKYMQLVVMSLKVGEDIPLEVHEGHDQFIRIEQGSADVTIDGKRFSLEADDIIIIPAGTKHYVRNSSKNKDLKLYTIYSPSEHKPGTIHKTQADAEKAHH